MVALMGVNLERFRDPWLVLLRLFIFSSSFKVLKIRCGAIVFPVYLDATNKFLEGEIVAVNSSSTY